MSTCVLGRRGAFKRGYNVKTNENNNNKKPVLCANYLL